MKKLLFIFFTAGLIQGFSSCSHKDTPDNALALIPQPQEMKVGTDHFKLTRRAAITLDTSNPQLIGIARYFNNKVAPATGFEIPVEKHGNIEFKLTDNTAFGAEGYRLQVKHGDIIITAHQPAGIFYGIQTLLQMLPPEIKNSQKQKGINWTVPCTDITDKPQFAWRGLMLDVSRHWFTKEKVKKYIDELAEYKMNVFHWHLTDDQGWRIEIKKYPLLTKIGGKRDSTQIGNWNSNIYDGKVHEGFYTQEEIKEIIDYAAKRQITIVPEIEMPGHASAAIAAYPQLGTEKQSIKVPTRFGVQYHAYNVADPKVIQFIKDVLDEVCNLFPSETIHIGGDEVKYDQWKKSAQVRNFMKEQNIKTPADLQIWFTNTISHYLENKKKHMMGWNEITGVKIHDYTDFEDAASGASLAEGTIVHFWRGDPSLIKQTVKKGYQVVNSYHEYTYLDYDTAYTSLEKAYHFDPLAGITGKETDLIIGIGAQMWGEWIPTPSDMYRKLYPRIAAFAECGWTSPSNKSWKRFNQAAYKENLRWKQLYQ